MHNPSAYYLARKSKLLKDFDRSAKVVREVLVAGFGEDQVSTLIKESRVEYERIIPQLPYIGGQQPFT